MRLKFSPRSRFLCGFLGNVYQLEEPLPLVIGKYLLELFCRFLFEQTICWVYTYLMRGNKNKINLRRNVLIEFAYFCQLGKSGNEEFVGYV